MNAFERFAAFCETRSADCPPTLTIFPKYHSDGQFTVVINADNQPGVAGTFPDTAGFDAKVKQICDRLDADKAWRGGVKPEV
jgi:hypothetical protein